MPTTTQTPYRKKLIEVDLPLDAINLESAKEKPVAGKGHPSTIHRWWARRPLVACRAIIFASIVDDPGELSEFPGLLSQNTERERLHQIIRELSQIKNTHNEHVLNIAKFEIARSVARAENDDPPPNVPAIVNAYLRDHAPAVYDPFCGGGSIPVEAQRLGARPIASDLNPVAVLITKALIEIPAKFSGIPAKHPDGFSIKAHWEGSTGLGADIRYYGERVRDEALRRIGHLYPKTLLHDGTPAIAHTWLWVRTIECLNPSCRVQMPITKSFQLSKRSGHEVWLKPIHSTTNGDFSYKIQNNSRGVPKTGTVDRTTATCILCETPVTRTQLRELGNLGKINEQLVATVAESGRTRAIVEPTHQEFVATNSGELNWQPDGNLPQQSIGIRSLLYGYTKWYQHFSHRQLVFLTTMVDTIKSIRREILRDNDGDVEHADAVATYLGLTVGRAADFGSIFNRWDVVNRRVFPLFSRQTFTLIWDHAEINPFAGGRQDWRSQVDWVAHCVDKAPQNPTVGIVKQSDAKKIINDEKCLFITDPPYYDNIHYAEVSDFFYIWHRATLREIYPELYSTIVTPKQEEMVANRFRDQDPASEFETSLGTALKNIRSHCTVEFPSNIIYAYKQQDATLEGSASTGWETMLNAIVGSDFQIMRTWPMRTEHPTRPRAHLSNALATSVSIVIRPRHPDAHVATRQEFLDELDTELPRELDRLTHGGHIAPADLPQAAIGPGMEIYSQILLRRNHIR